jgi:uncharacterized repeat protein (TIGR03943 family)
VTGAGGTLTALVGLLTLRLTVDGTFLRYVRPGMRVWLLIAGVALLALGLVALVQALRARPSGLAEEPSGTDEDDQDDVDHEHGVGVGWLLLVPVAVLLLVAPPSLGSFGVGRSPAIRVTSGRSQLPALNTSAGTVPMTLTEYTERAFDHRGQSLGGATVQLTGFVSSTGSGHFQLARYQIACCAADAAAATVQIVGVASIPPRDQWVTVTGTYSAAEGDDPVLAATIVQNIAAPEDPYE